jgi:hypothetical protein
MCTLEPGQSRAALQMLERARLANIPINAKMTECAAQACAAAGNVSTAIALCIQQYHCLLSTHCCNLFIVTLVDSSQLWYNASLL